jgi:branched-chain amino acid transport system permease protein
VTNRLTDDWRTRAAIGACVLTLLVLGLAGGTEAVAGADVRTVVTVMFINVVLVTGISVFSGNTGLISFGHVGFMAIGAYVATWLTLTADQQLTLFPLLPWPFAGAHAELWIALLVAAGVAGLVGSLLGAPLMRLTPATLGTGSFGVLIVVYVVFSATESLGRSGQTVYGVPQLAGLWMTAICAAIVLSIARFVRESPLGLALRATRDDEVAAGANGVSVYKVRLAAWTLSAAIVGVGGALWAHQLTAFSPRSFYFSETFLLMAMLIIGGMGSASGALAGTVVVTLVSEVLRRISGMSFAAGTPLGAPGASTVLLGVIIIAVMAVRPAGILAVREFDELVGRLLSRWGFGRPTKGIDPASEERAPPMTVLQVSHVNHRFAGVRALNDVSFEMRTGEIVGLIGPNGSGKTTLLNIISGQIRPTSGRVQVGDRNLASMPPHRRFALGLARTFQNIRLFGSLSAIENVEVALAHLEARATRTRARALLAQYRVNRPDVSPVSFPYGDQRRVEVARAVAGVPSFVLLDEPAAGMNEVETEELGQRLRDMRDVRGLGLLVTEHDLSLILSVCDRIVVLSEGQVIASGTASEIRSSDAVRVAYIGEDDASEPHALGDILGGAE